MNNKYSATRTFRRARLGAAIACAIAGSVALPAQAFEFGEGNWTGSLDTTISYGVSKRVEDIDNDLIGKSNLNPAIGAQSNAAQRAAPGRWSVNSDDGNLNYDDGDLFSNAVKV